MILENKELKKVTRQISELLDKSNFSKIRFQPNN